MIALIFILLLLVLILSYQLYARNVQVIPTEEIVVPYPVYAAPSVRREPVFPRAPYKQYKPKQFQQMGLLLGGADEILPLYGRESRVYRDRYQYYSSSPGEQIYSLPITHQDRECTEDIGCQELYGGETVAVNGKTGDYTVKIYDTEQLYY